jgi:hypothetical protein
LRKIHNTKTTFRSITDDSATFGDMMRHHTLTGKIQFFL